MVKEPYFIIMGKFIKDSLKIIKNKDLDLKYTQMVLNIKDITKMEREMGKVDFNGLTDNYMMGNGKTI